MLNETSKESAAFLVTNASGRHINLLNDNEAHNQQQQSVFTTNTTAPSPPLSEISDEINNNSSDRLMSPTEGPSSSSSSSKRKYHCTEPGCTKSFTTSGHLARHNRIHTGEKNFPCLFPGCQSRFSRQDNMMQHYRTHMSPKSRRTQHKKVISEDLHPRPRLHAHQRIRSDPYRVERPLTIDQHLNNYRRSLLSHPSSSNSSNSNNSVKYNMPTPLGSVAASHMQKQQQQQQQQQLQQQSSSSYMNSNGTWSVEPVAHQTSHQEGVNEDDDDMELNESVTPSSSLYTPSPPIVAPDMIFYQHKPLTFSTEVNKIKSSHLPFTLLHPTRVPITPPQPQPYIDLQQETNNITPSLSLSSSSTDTTTDTTTDNNNNDTSSSSQAGLLQLAHIVSTFG